MADTDGLPPVRLADGAAGAGADALADGPAELSFSDGPATDPPPPDAWHPARTTTTATIHPPAHHRIPAPPGPRIRPRCSVRLVLERVSVPSLSYCRPLK
ncbi:hypothetical protein AB0N16_26115 [Streptomyces sp. NPDC051105]|uniref:hypothetical protein n=1 Tax=Streptomyces sp. NPDC051105 TaxID=3154843 RepID=UPI003416FC8C